MDPLLVCVSLCLWGMMLCEGGCDGVCSRQPSLSTSSCLYIDSRISTLYMTSRLEIDYGR